MSVRNVCMAAGRKVGHAFKAHCLAHMGPLFRLSETLSERYDGLRLAFKPSGSAHHQALEITIRNSVRMLHIAPWWRAVATLRPSPARPFPVCSILPPNARNLLTDGLSCGSILLGAVATRRPPPSRLRCVTRRVALHAYGDQEVCV